MEIPLNDALVQVLQKTSNGLFQPLPILDYRPGDPPVIIVGEAPVEID